MTIIDRVCSGSCDKDENSISYSQCAKNCEHYGMDHYNATSCARQIIKRAASPATLGCPDGQELQDGKCKWKCPAGGKREGHSTVCMFDPLDSKDIISIPGVDTYAEGDELSMLGFPGYRKTSTKQIGRKGGFFDFHGKTDDSRTPPIVICDTGYEDGKDGVCYLKMPKGVDCKGSSCELPCADGFPLVNGVCTRPSRTKPYAEAHCEAGYTFHKDSFTCSKETPDNDGGKPVDATPWIVGAIVVAGVGAAGLVLYLKYGKKKSPAKAPASTK